jgi:hypothetical protein
MEPEKKIVYSGGAPGQNDDLPVEIGVATLLRYDDKKTLISSLLFTLGLLYLVPSFWSAVRTAHGGIVPSTGWCCIATVLIGIVIAWTGYARRKRSAWLMMAIIVFGWALPCFILPLRYAAVSESNELLKGVRYAGLTPPPAQTIAVFLLMVVALMVPVTSFFGSRADAPGSTTEIANEERRRAEIRCAPVLVSSVMFTVALLCVVLWACEMAGSREYIMFRVAAWAGLANPVIGLVVIWTAYTRRARWAWFVMMIMVWVAFFLGGVYPMVGFFGLLPTVHMRELFSAAFRGNFFGAQGLETALARMLLIFWTNVIAVLLPIFSFFRRESPKA